MCSFNGWVRFHYISVQSFFICSSVDGHLVCFHVLAIVKNFWSLWLWEYQIVYENKWTRRVCLFFFPQKSIAFAFCMESVTPAAIRKLLKCQVSLKRVKSFTQCIPQQLIQCMPAIVIQPFYDLYFGNLYSSLLIYSHIWSLKILTF